MKQHTSRSSRKWSCACWYHITFAKVASYKEFVHKYDDEILLSVTSMIISDEATVT